MISIDYGKFGKKIFPVSTKILRGLKNTSYLAVGNIISLLINFIGFIYIARLLGVHDFGIYAMVGAFVSIFDLFLLKGLKKPVLREGSKDISSMYIYLEKTIGIRSVLIILAMTVCIISSFFTPYELQIKLLIILFSAQLAFHGLQGFLDTIFQATEKMQYIAILNIIHSILFVSLAIIVLYFGFGLLALFLISLFSQLLTHLIRYNFSKKFVKFNVFSEIHFNKVLLKPAFVFSLLLFVGYLTTKVDLVMISFLGAAQDVGLYGVAYQIVFQGVMLRNVTANAFFPIFVKQFYKGKIKGRVLLKYSLIFFVGILALSIVASFYVEEIVLFLFGSEYKYSGVILRVLIFYLASVWATLPITTALQATYNEKTLLIGRSIMAGLNIPLNYIFFMMYGLIGIAYSTLVIYSIGGVIICVSSYYVMKKQGYLI